MRSRYVLPFIQNLQHMVYTNFHVTLRELAPGLFSIPAGQFQVFLDEASLPDFLYEFDIYDSIWMNDRIHMNMIEEQMNSFVSRRKTCVDNNCNTIYLLRCHFQGNRLGAERKTWRLSSQTEV
ncbi:hypothetical protein LWI29_007238 [Acer saccharum]|uniref:Uncharacterized protein n=1 Tax=Acer saccharum TaxID=4024 RepID=A0AA39S3M7_ACESA|nr:hypothetical protein LWI29_007238 [Acer saccharum]